ncbi:MAG: helix-turn-helix transcriptional regulator [Verrucomicrobia bacterium]|nr:helix-turn-helix transcriptional regulator [Verrucomicrobiota bacterium]
MYKTWFMDEFLSHVEVQMLESRISNLTPSYWRKEGDNRPYARIYYVKSGAGFIRPYGREYPLRPGRLYLVPPRGDFAYGCTSNLQIWWMHFAATLFGCIDLFDYLPHHVERKPENVAVLEKRMLRLLEMARSQHAADQIEGTGILLQLVAPFFNDPPPTIQRELQEGRRRLLPVLKHIDENLGRVISVPGLARVACYEKSHFSTLFTQLFGVPPMRYVNRKRIERVQLILARSDAKLEGLAREFGFSDAFHLSKTFKRETGLSPREFRKSKRESVP